MIKNEEIFPIKVFLNKRTNYPSVIISLIC